MGACARNMQSDPAEIKPAQCCIKLVFSFDLYYDARKHKIKINSELPLSVCAIMASLSLSFVFMFLIVLVCVCMLWLCWGLFDCRVFMRSAVSFLYTSRSVRGRCAIAVSASRARFCIQFFGLLCRLYLMMRSQHHLAIQAYI